MKQIFNNPPNLKPKKLDDKTQEDKTYSSLPDETPRREGGLDSFAEADPTDSNADEKVIVNSQEENELVNTDSQNKIAEQ
jgi:hypothetical protein